MNETQTTAEALAAMRAMPPERRKAIRVGAGLSRADIARSLPCSEAAVRYWERGERTPRGMLGERYAALLLDLERGQQ